MTLSHSTEKNIDYCTYCPKMCHFSCPVAEVEKNETLTPWGKQQTLNQLQKEKLEWSRENVLPAYKCLTCRNSQELCHHDIAVADGFMEVREEAVQKGIAPESVYQFKEKFQKHHNPYGVDLKEKAKNKIPLHWLKNSSASTLFFPTCHLLQSDGWENLINLFQKMKVDSIYVPEAALECCGASLGELGFQEEFKEQAQTQFDTLKKAKKIVVGSPECAWALRSTYSKIGIRFEAKIETLVEFVGGIFSKLPIRSKAKTPSHYFYHDSCYLGRYLGIYDLPRKILKQVTGVEPLEFSSFRNESLCSGAGGGYEQVAPEMAQAIPKRHFEELKEKKSTFLITGCYKSASHFKKSEPKLQVKDLFSFLNENLEEMEEEFI